MNPHTVGGLTPETSKLFRVQKTCFKMLRKRGYHIDDKYINMTTDEFRNDYGEVPSRENLTIQVQKVDDPEDQLYIFFPEGEKNDKSGKC